MAEYSTILRLLPLLWLSHFFEYTLSQFCYYPDGTSAGRGHFPCNQSAFTTFCCLQGWTCFSNDLCIATDPSVISSAVPIGTSYRGTCTNPDWNDSACGNFCLSKILLGSFIASQTNFGSRPRGQLRFPSLLRTEYVVL